MMKPDLILITSPDCHLCLHARSVLSELSLSAREIDVESQEAANLAERGIPLTFLPVLLDGERLVAYGRFSSRRLSKDLAR